MADTLQIVEVPALHANRENVADYGLFIGTDLPGTGLTASYYKGTVEEGVSVPFECQGSAVVRSWRIHKRSSEVTWLERHLRTTQVFIGLGNQPFALVLGKPSHGQGENRPRVREVRCFIFQPGHGIMLHKGTWHDVPRCVNESVTVLTIGSPAVAAAPASTAEERETDQGDVYKINVKQRVGKTLLVKV